MSISSLSDYLLPGHSPVSHFELISRDDKCVNFLLKCEKSPRFEPHRQPLCHLFAEFAQYDLSQNEKLQRLSWLFHAVIAPAEDTALKGEVLQLVESELGLGERALEVIFDYGMTHEKAIDDYKARISSLPKKKRRRMRLWDPGNPANKAVSSASKTAMQRRQNCESSNQ